MEIVNPTWAWYHGDPGDSPYPVLLDFETRSRLDIEAVCTERYASHESTDVLCAAYQVDWGDPGLWVPGQPFPFSDIWPNVRVLAFNAEFEWYIWQEQLVKKHGWPPLPEDFMDCLRARAAAAGLPRKLSAIGRPLGMGDHGKDMEGHRNMLRLCVAGGSPVLTEAGWVPIERIPPDVCLWDGREWVTHDGVVSTGIMDVVDFCGVKMTPDHRVLNRSGVWVQACVANPNNLEDANVPTWAGQIDRPAPRVPGMAEYAVEMPQPESVGVPILRWTRYTGVPTLAKIFSGVLGRHGWHVFSGGVAYQPRARAGSNEVSEPTRVYDILNCGPRNRFVVLGDKPFIVHNCKPVGGKLQGDIYVGGEFDDDPERHRRNERYCLNDIRAETVLARICPPLTTELTALYHATHAINARGCPIDEGFCRVAHQLVRLENDQLGDRLHDITGIDDVTPNSLPKLKGWMAEIGVPFPKTANGLPQLDEKVLKSALDGDYGELDPRVMKVLEIRALSRDASVAKYPKMLQYAVNGRVKNGHTFYQAGTGRFAFGGPQFQNLRRLNEDTLPVRMKMANWLSELDGGPPEAILDAFEYLTENYKEGIIPLLGGMVRLALKAEPGHKFIVSDWSAIEMRMLHWLAGDERMLNQIRDFDNGIGEDPYKIAAAEMYGKKVSDITKAERQRGKVRELGSGYAAGAQTLKEFAADYGLRLSIEQTKDMVQGWRRSHPLAKKLWYELQDAALAAISKGGVHEVGYIYYYRTGATLNARLPSGREIKYHNACIVDGPFGPEVEADSTVNSARRRVDMPTLIENVNQGASFDLLMNTMIRCEQEGVGLVLTVHDEVVDHAPDAEVDRRLAIIKDVMTEAPAWAKGLPLRVGTGVDTRYSK